MAVVKEVLLFGPQTWLINPKLEKALEGFHHRAVRQMVVMGPKRQQYGKCAVLFYKVRTNNTPGEPSGSVVLIYLLGQPK